MAGTSPAMTGTVAASVVGPDAVARMSKGYPGSSVLAVLAPPSCPGLSRASTSCLVTLKNVDGRDKPGHDGNCCCLCRWSRCRSPDEQRISGILCPRRTRSAVVPGLVPGIHVLTLKNVDGRDVGAKQSFVASHGHDGEFVHAAVVGGGGVARMSKAIIGTLRRSPYSLRRRARACPGHPRPGDAEERGWP